MTELIEPGANGYLFPFGDWKALSDLLYKMHIDDTMILDPKVCKNKVAQFEKGSALEDFYQKVIGLVEETDEPDSSEEKSRKISVVIPCYNAERTIDACLTSLVHQTVPLQQIELILVNNGSTDHTFEKLSEWEGQYSDTIMVDTGPRHFGKQSRRGRRDKGIEPYRRVITFP